MTEEALQIRQRFFDEMVQERKRCEEARRLKLDQLDQYVLSLHIFLLLI